MITFLAKGGNVEKGGLYIHGALMTSSGFRLGRLSSLLCHRLLSGGSTPHPSPGVETPPDCLMRSFTGRLLPPDDTCGKEGVPMALGVCKATYGGVLCVMGGDMGI